MNRRWLTLAWIVLLIILSVGGTVCGVIAAFIPVPDDQDKFIYALADKGWWTTYAALAGVVVTVLTACERLIKWMRATG